MTNMGDFVWRLRVTDFAGVYGGRLELVGFERFDIRWPVC